MLTTLLYCSQKPEACIHPSKNCSYCIFCTLCKNSKKLHNAQRNLLIVCGAPPTKNMAPVPLSLHIVLLPPSTSNFPSPTEPSITRATLLILWTWPVSSNSGQSTRVLVIKPSQDMQPLSGTHHPNMSRSLSCSFKCVEKTVFNNVPLSYRVSLHVVL